MKSIRCPISGDDESDLIFSYKSPPVGEMKFDSIKLEIFEGERLIRTLHQKAPKGVQRWLWRVVLVLR